MRKKLAILNFVLSKVIHTDLWSLYFESLKWFFNALQRNLSIMGTVGTRISVQPIEVLTVSRHKY